jgi:hypothetical protein
MALLSRMLLHLLLTRPLHLLQPQPLSPIHTLAPTPAVPTRLHHRHEHTLLYRRDVNQPRTMTTSCAPATLRRTTQPLTLRQRTQPHPPRPSDIATTPSLSVAEVVLRTFPTNLPTATRSDIPDGSWSALATPAHTSAVSTTQTPHSLGVCVV